MAHNFETQMEKLEDMRLRVQFSQGEPDKVTDTLNQLDRRRRLLLHAFYGVLR